MEESDSKGRVVLTCQPSSSGFDVKTVFINEQEPEVIGRSTKEEPVQTSNCRFLSKVLSKEHAKISYKYSEFFIQDLGSSNGTFIGDFRLKSEGEASEVRIYSGDVIRFGAATLNKQRRQNEKCVIAKFELFHPTGEKEIRRPASESLSSPEKDNVKVLTSDKPKRKKQRVVKLNDEVKIYEDLRELSDHEDQLAEFERQQQKAAEQQLAVRKETALELVKLKEQVDQLEKKLKRKNNEVKNLTENLNSTKKESEEFESTILELRTESEELKMNLTKTQEENLKLYDQLALKAKEILENVKVSELESELEDHKRMLNKTQEENWLLREKLRLESEQIRSLEDALRDELKKKSRRVTGDFDDEEVQQILEEKENQLKSKLEELEVAEEMLKKADEMMKERDRENAWLNDMLSQHVEKIQEKESEFQSLQHCMTEENETVHQIEKEMVRLIKIIEEDQANAAIKDHMISGYSEEIKYLKEKLDAEKQNLEKQKETADQNLEIALNHKNSEIETLQKEVEEIRAGVQEKETQLQQTSENLKQSETKITNLETELSKIQEIMKAQQADLDKLRGENQRLKSLGENGVDYRTLQQKLIREQQLNKELEDEVIQLKMERSNQENGYGRGRPPSQQDESGEELFRGLSDEIKRLQTELLNEKQISNHIQITQEKELLLKDREIQRLSAMFNPLGVISKISKGRNKADLAALMSRRGLETSDTETEETLSLSYHDAMSGEDSGKDRVLDADEISLG